MCDDGAHAGGGALPEPVDRCVPVADLVEDDANAAALAALPPPPLAADPVESTLRNPPLGGVCPSDGGVGAFGLCLRPLLLLGLMMAKKIADGTSSKAPYFHHHWTWRGGATTRRAYPIVCAKNTTMMTALLSRSRTVRAR